MLRTFLGLVVVASLLFVDAGANAVAEEPGRFLGTYRARLSERDHHNSKGKRLRSAAGVIRQDRAWVHRYDKMDNEDQHDSVFGDYKMRAVLEKMLKGQLSTAAKRRILDGHPLIEVTIYEDRLVIEFLE